MPVEIKGVWRPLTGHYDADHADVSPADLDEYGYALSKGDPDQELEIWIHPSSHHSGLRISLMGLGGCCGGADLAVVVGSSLDDELLSEMPQTLKALTEFRDKINAMIERYRALSPSQGSEGERR